jgi:hypothetical protein
VVHSQGQGIPPGSHRIQEMAQGHSGGQSRKDQAEEGDRDDAPFQILRSRRSAGSAWAGAPGLPAAPGPQGVGGGLPSPPGHDVRRGRTQFRQGSRSFPVGWLFMEAPSGARSPTASGLVLRGGDEHPAVTTRAVRSLLRGTG